jgi:hypothetical protein
MSSKGSGKVVERFLRLGEEIRETNAIKLVFPPSTCILGMREPDGAFGRWLVKVRMARRLCTCGGRAARNA